MFAALLAAKQQKRQDSPGLPGWKPNLLADKNRKDKQLCRYYRNIMRSEKTEIPVILQLWLFEQRIALQMLVEEDIRKKCFAPYGLVNKTCRSEKKTEKKRFQTTTTRLVLRTCYYL